MINKQSRRMSPVSPSVHFPSPPLSPSSPTHSGKTPVVRGARACTVCRAAKVRIITFRSHIEIRFSFTNPL